MASGSAAPPRRPLTLADVEPGSENERLGVARDSMLRNPRILKAELGKPQRNCYTLPGFDFSYGLYSQRMDGGVPEAIGQWNTVKPSPPSVQNTPRDFITMNRGALKAGYTTAHEFNLYYKAKDIRCKPEEYIHLKRDPPKVPADMTYGITTRPCTPFFDLIQHKYKELWMEEQRALTIAQQVEKKKVGPHLSTFPDCEAGKKSLQCLPLRSACEMQTSFPEHPHSECHSMEHHSP
ncbi:cilia- and flagella-associated protein 77 isoform X2 [Colius striatus]|uniref:cilia- and flagella-associated protein 77 isoform X2 n=1 Tax=Colius striatus TaxID=57412 RepID=UPI002B1E19DA|nr:cilia- and flagella-associated protein 77 isoform X2 [Colius striatus]